MHLNIEIKARSGNASFVRNYLQQQGAEYKGTDQQTDTYFNTTSGRLKLRQGNIENNLIWYNRANQEGPKSSTFRLYPAGDGVSLLAMLTGALGIKVVVKKSREIYYINNVKFHIDTVEGLGSFVEIEAGNILAPLTAAELEAQCRFYMQAFRIEEKDLLKHSYSDMLMANGSE